MRSATALKELGCATGQCGKNHLGDRNEFLPTVHGFDDIIGGVMKQLDEMGIADNTIVVVSTDNGTEGFTWPDGGTTPFKGWKGMGTEGGFRVPAVIRWPGKVKPSQVINQVMSGLDWFSHVRRGRRLRR
jgi:arylsulfatase A-like enzyme